ncbi:MAG: diacylglycerol kinase family lipid kinase, partial [Methylacidiphilales bacterium]|nr:diacylglycerol kinase family lipid kinase [Candidatus Methylacidiphilales bacterium]
MSDERRIAIIFNPTANSEKAAQVLNQLSRIVNRRATIFETQSIGDALPLTLEAIRSGYSTIVAAGGDGTLNEVINGIPFSMLERGAIQVGVLPLGTMNVFAHEIRIPARLDEAWSIILQNKIRHIDLPRLDHRRFIQLAGIGFDAQVVQLTTWESKRQLGPLSYILS